MHLFFQNDSVVIKRVFTDLSKAVKFVSEKSDELEKHRFEKEKPINDLKSKFSSLKEKGKKNLKI